MARFLISLGVVAIASVMAQAQSTYMPWSSLFEQPLRTSIDGHATRLLDECCQLSQEQQLAARRLLDKHLDTFQAFALESKPLVVNLDEQVRSARGRSLQQFNVNRERERILAEIADRQARLDEQFLEDVKSLLAEAQLDCWEHFLARFNQHRWRSAGTLYAEEAVDHIKLLEDLSSAEKHDLLNPELNAILLSYHLRMNQALVKLRDNDVGFARNYYRSPRWQTDGERVWLGPADDESEEKRWLKNRLAQHRRLRDLNREHLPLIQILIPDHLREKHMETYVSRALLPLINQEQLPSRKWLQRVLELADLDAQARGEVERLAAEFSVRSDAAVKEILRAQAREVEGRFAAKPDDRAALEQELSDAVKRLSALHEEVFKLTWTLLNESQREKVKPIENYLLTTAAEPHTE